MTAPGLSVVLNTLWWVFMICVWGWSIYVLLACIDNWGPLARYEVATHPLEPDRKVVRGTYRWLWAAERAQRRMNKGLEGDQALWFLVPSERAYVQRK